LNFQCINYSGNTAKVRHRHEERQRRRLAALPRGGKVEGKMKKIVFLILLLIMLASLD
jgi:hypothetical protein